MLSNDEFLDKMRSTVEAMADQTKKVDKSWWGVSRAVESIGRAFETGWAAALSKRFGKQSDIIQAMDKVKHFLEDPTAFNKGKHAAFAKAFQETLLYLPAIVMNLHDAARWSDDMQKSLAQANGDLATRYRLMTDIASVQMRTGASADTLAEATQAALKYGIELGPTYRNDLDIITKMKDGLGVSSDSSASMVASMRLMGQSAKGVADSIARIKADTGLAADEATRLAKQITTAMSVMAPGGNVSQVVEKIGRLEGAAVQLGFSSGKITEMMEGWTKQSGLMSAGILGLQPDFLKDQTTTMMAFQRMVEFTETQLKATEGNAYARQAVLTQYAEIFGTSTEIIANGSKILAEYNKQARSTTDLQKEWQTQTSTFSKAWEKLKNQMWGLVQSALLPLIKYTAIATDSLSGWVTSIQDSSAAVWLMRSVFAGGFLLTLRSLGRMAPALATALNSLGSMVGLGGSLGKVLGPVTKLFSSLGGAGSALGMMGRFLGPAGWGVIGWQLGRLIGANTKLDETMQKAFLRTIYGVRGNAPEDIPMKGVITGQQWFARIEQMRAKGLPELKVHDWAFSHLKDVKELLEADPNNLTSKGLAGIAKGMVDRYFDEAHARERMIDYETMTPEADARYAVAKQAADTLLRLEELAVLQEEILRLGHLDQREEAVKAHKAADDAKTEAAFDRQKPAAKPAFKFILPRRSEVY